LPKITGIGQVLLELLLKVGWYTFLQHSVVSSCITTSSVSVIRRQRFWALPISEAAWWWLCFVVTLGLDVTVVKLQTVKAVNSQQQEEECSTVFIEPLLLNVVAKPLKRYTKKPKHLTNC